MASITFTTTRDYPNDDTFLEFDGSNNYPTTSPIRAGYDSFQHMWLGLRWQAVNIPKNSTINSATLRMVAASGLGAGGPTGLGTVYGELATNGADWSARSPSSVSKTTANAQLVGSSTGGTVCDTTVTSIIQEIVNQANWMATGNTLVLISDATGISANALGGGTNNNYVNYKCTDGTVAGGDLGFAQLIVDYTPPSLGASSGGGGSSGRGMGLHSRWVDPRGSRGFGGTASLLVKRETGALAAAIDDWYLPATSSSGNNASVGATLTFTGAASDSASANAAAAAGLGLTGAAADSASANAAASAGLGLTGTANASSLSAANAVAAITLNLTGAASDSASENAAVSAVLGITGVSAGSATDRANAAITLNLTGAAAASTLADTSGTITLTIIGVGTESAGANSAVSGVLGLTGAGSDSAADRVSAAATFSFAGAAAASTSDRANAAATLTLTGVGAAVSVQTANALASSSLGFSGAGAGSAPGDLSGGAVIALTGAVTTSAPADASMGGLLVLTGDGEARKYAKRFATVGRPAATPSKRAGQFSGGDRSPPAGSHRTVQVSGGARPQQVSTSSRR